MGNVLRRDDGFGVEVARRLLAADSLPPHVRVVEVGIGGISLVQELMTPPGYDILLLIDAAARGDEPGRVAVLDVDVPATDELPALVRQDFFADMHYATPDRALTLAQAVGALPQQTFIIGCQPGNCEYAIGLTPPVAAAVDEALRLIAQLVEQLSAQPNQSPAGAAP